MANLRIINQESLAGDPVVMFPPDSTEVASSVEATSEASFDYGITSPYVYVGILKPIDDVEITKTGVRSMLVEWNDANTPRILQYQVIVIADITNLNPDAVYVLTVGDVSLSFLENKTGSQGTDTGTVEDEEESNSDALIDSSRATVNLMVGNQIEKRIGYHQNYKDTGDTDYSPRVTGSIVLDQRFGCIVMLRFETAPDESLFKAFIENKGYNIGVSGDDRAFVATMRNDTEDDFSEIVGGGYSVRVGGWCTLDVE